MEATDVGIASRVRSVGVDLGDHRVTSEPGVQKRHHLDEPVEPFGVGVHLVQDVPVEPLVDAPGGVSRRVVDRGQQGWADFCESNDRQPPLYEETIAGRG